MKQRLQKIIADAGITSRRKAEDLIREGRVSVDGRVVQKLGSVADPDVEKVKVNGKLITGKPHRLYLLLNKPRNYVTSLSDPEQRPSVSDLLKRIKVRVFPVGRLDYDAEGLLVLTNDGSFAHKLLHPRFEVPRTYVVKVKGLPEMDAIKALRTGVPLSDGMTSPAQVKFLEKAKRNSWLVITVKEGRNKLIKRLCTAVGHPVLKLKRTKFGPFSLGDLRPGEHKIIPPEEVRALLSEL